MSTDMAFRISGSKNNLYPSPNRRMRWMGHVAHMGESRGVYRVWWGNLREGDRLEDPVVDGRIILRWIFRKGHMRVWTGSIWFRMWQALVNAVINLRVP